MEARRRGKPGGPGDRFRDSAAELRPPDPASAPSGKGETVG
jgi:hypothetical protein